MSLRIDFRKPFAIKDGQYTIKEGSYPASNYKEFELYNGYVKIEYKSGAKTVFKASAAWLRYADKALYQGFIVPIVERK